MADAAAGGADTHIMFATALPCLQPQQLQQPVRAGVLAVLAVANHEHVAAGLLVMLTSDFRLGLRNVSHIGLVRNGGIFLSRILAERARFVEAERFLAAPVARQAETAGAATHADLLKFTAAALALEVVEVA